MKERVEGGRWKIKRQIVCEKEKKRVKTRENQQERRRVLFKIAIRKGRVQKKWENKMRKNRFKRKEGRRKKGDQGRNSYREIKIKREKRESVLKVLLKVWESHRQALFGIERVQMESKSENKKEG